MTGSKTSDAIALAGADIFDGQDLHQGLALVVEPGSVSGLFAQSNLPDHIETLELRGGTLVPGFIDLQVNGGGGVLLNEQPTLSGIETICKAHRPFGTTALLPTLITDTPEITQRAIEAGIAATEKNVPGFLGLHLEGPHLARAKKGAHDPDLIRPMTSQDLSILIAAKERLENLMVTVAPESVTEQQITDLSHAGIVVSLGHSDADYAQVQRAIAAGAQCVTHLYNAMSPLSHREPGMVGATLQSGEICAGIIADGYHVDPAAISIALAAKQQPGRIFLVTDAMSTIGTDMKSLQLNGRTILRKDGRLTLEDGTLAGADLDMITAVRFMISQVGLEPMEAYRMAAAYPAQCMKISPRFGTLCPGAEANIVHLDENHRVTRTWIGGK